MNLLEIGNGQRARLVLPGHHDGLVNLMGDGRLMFIPSFARPKLGKAELSATLDGRAITITEVAYCRAGEAYLATFRD